MGVQEDSRSGSLCGNQAIETPELIGVRMKEYVAAATNLSGVGSAAVLRTKAGYAALPIRNILVEQTGHTPWVAGRPFFIVMAWALLISLLSGTSNNTLPRHSSKLVVVESILQLEH